MSIRAGEGGTPVEISLVRKRLCEGRRGRELQDSRPVRTGSFQTPKNQELEFILLSNFQAKE